MTNVRGAPPPAACEIRFGQLGLAQVRVRSLDAESIRAELAAKVEGAPQLFARAGVCMDFSALAAQPGVDAVRAVLAAVRAAGMLPVGIAYGTPELAALAQALDLPVLAKFRAAYEVPVGGASAPNAIPHAGESAVGAEAPPTPSDDPSASRAVGAMIHSQPVRSGQQVHARGRDLVVLGTVGAGAEVIADGSLHVYGPLRGRALAGAQGDASARIYCREFEAELVAIAGVFRIFEEIPEALRGKPVQVRLEHDHVTISAF